MYIFQLMGGLGNQMFQYAAAKALSGHTISSVKVDFDSPYKHVNYVYNLGVFKLQVEKATFKDLWLAKPKKKLLKRFFMVAGKNPDCRLVTEKRDFQYDNTFFEIPDGSYVRGFWQSELYFKSIEDLIRKDFTFASEPKNHNKEIAKAITSQQAVSLHIRRGDYVNIPSTNEFHGTCSIEYYQKAIEYILSKVSNAVFYIFSDDLPWAKENLKVSALHIFVEGNDAVTNYEDLRLMSLCQHHIIANSSFSWWGAWLNPSKTKIVIAPGKWMNDPGFETKDLIPKAWIRL